VGIEADDLLDLLLDALRFGGRQVDPWDASTTRSPPSQAVSERETS